ncbi:uncharacterized protein LOC118278488 isoform X2 [Spodoptera frugiperda]|uniref:Uncharacterized protein LOC118278488 isoform X2 n=1 Tax=Spodoptera frugiperda TaxID=7108 RepID=A0A9R0F3M0_SPOFR|nr:uncharacterized protein LOC118278488 isoform X2 [Spodoptera frugiperda]
MDDTAQSRASDAAATRKRRSSILKSQRPARTPFSELEFNVATPTDTAKSRRVSFSRRTGVAEFVTNEATTTWKNFYEEHNKSLESSSNDSEANASRQPVGHLGKRIFDQQFEEFEAVDFISNVNPSHISNGSLNSINFTQQFASLDCTSDTKPTAPQNQFDLSTFTEQQSKIFGNEFIASAIGENSGRIDVNFSNIQEIGGKDDLDEIEKDLERGPSSLGCHGPFASRQSLSEYIEVDLNMTHVARNDEDMSITDTIHSPVQDVSKSTSIDKKVSLNPDWVADKENIAVNPYVTPCEADNFAVHEEPNQVLVFDGKRLTLQPDKPVPDTEKNYRQTLLPSTSFETPQRKTIVLNVNDDLPNFVDDMLNSKCESSAFVSRDGGSTSFAVDVPKKVLDTTGNISMTQALPTNIISDTAVTNEDSSKRRTIVFNESMGNISVTQSLPGKLFCNPVPSERRRTVVYENDTGNISITQAVPTNILVGETSNKEKRKTIVFEDEQADISMTQALPSNVILAENTKEKRKTIVFEDDQANISMTQALPNNVILGNNMGEKRKTIVFEDEQANISVTQALPSNVILDNNTKEKRKTIVFEDEQANISVTQALPNNVIMGENTKEKRKTIVFEDEQANISVTQALPSNVVLGINTGEKRKTIVFEDEQANISVTQALPSNVILDNNTKEKRKTIVFEDEQANISVTQALPSNVILDNNTKEKRKTIVFEDEQANISVTQALPSNVILDNNTKEKRKTIVFNDDAGNVSITQALPANIMLPEKPSQERRRTIIYEDGVSNISVTQALPTNLILEQANPVTERRRTVVYGNETGNISITQLHSNVILERVEITDQFNFFSNTHSPPRDGDKRRRTIVYENDTGNISITQAIPTPIIAGSSEESCKTSSDDISLSKLLENPNLDDVSMTETVSSNILDDAADKKKSDVLNDDETDMTLALSTNVFLLDKLDSAIEQSVKLPEIVEEVGEIVINYDTYEEMPAKEETTLDSKKTVDEMPIMKVEPTVETQEEIKESIEQGHDDSSKIPTTKPIPPELVDIEKEMIDKSKCADVLEAENLTNQRPDVIVYQTATANVAPPALTEQGDLKSQSVNSVTDAKVVTSDIKVQEASDNKVEASDIKVEASDNKVEASDNKVEASDNKVEASDTKVEASDNKIEASDNKVEASDNKDCPELSVEELGSEDVSLVHPRVDERSDQLVLKTGTEIVSAMDVDEKPVDVPESEPSEEVKETVKIESKNTVLDALLDMSIVDETGTEDKELMPLESTHTVSEKKSDKASNISSESMFYVTKDSEDDAQTDKEENRVRERSDSISSLKDKEDDVEINTLEKKIEELKTSVTEMKESSVINQFYERVINSDLQYAVREEEKSKLRERGEIFKKANDTKELLDMISDFTEKDEDEYQPVVMKVKGQPSVEEKSEVVKPKRLSFAPKRQSIVLSREDLLNNISMAQAALQKSRLALDDSECDDTKDSSTASSKKADHTANEVVKTLHFDDESLSENDFKSDTKYSPLKKTAFGETSYMIESKAKVIPTYLKDVSDGIKELMLDLVKPMAYDNVPFDSGVVKKNPSTQSTQIQANLVTSSQVDIDSELDSYPESNYESDKMSSLAGHTLNKSRSRSFRSPMKFTSNSSEKSSEFEVPSPRQRYHRQPVEQPISSQVLVFDHLNPLNNILLSSIDYCEAHKYNPKKSDDTLCGSDPSRSALIHFEEDRKNEAVTTQYCVQSRQYAMQGDSGKEDSSMRSSNSRPISTDQSIDALRLHVKDNEANTLIAMKGNKELLEASSSLTLVDDALTPRYYGDINSRSTIYSLEPTACRKKKSPSKAETEKIDPTDYMQHSPLCAKAKKRIYSPNDREKYKNTQSSLDVTPKPSTKMQKISMSPKTCKVHIHEDIRHLAAEKDITDLPERQGNTSRGIEKRSPKKEKKSPANITVQQLITEYHTVDSGIDKHLLDALIPKSECSKEPSQSDVIDTNSLGMVSSFTSSKNLNAVDVYSSSTTQSSQFCHEMKGGKMEWHPELISAMSLNPSEIDSGVNVVAKIDMLPFMGSHECEWESSSPDTWSFRLLHGRLRLTARLAHRLDNATRTRVRGDTPVLDINVETVQQDKKNPVASMCVRFACETMRYMVSRACRGPCCVASDIPPLLRRCAAVARVALRWGRAMHDAKLHLAYTMDNEGYLTLKVANVPLRSVWEVSMRVELVVDDGRAAPWPRAGAVRVARVVSDVPVHEHELRRALAHTPRDWGHAPRTIWRMFRYLKHKTRDDELLLA